MPKNVAERELDELRLVPILHEVLPHDHHADGGPEPFCEYLARAIADRYNDPFDGWRVDARMPDGRPVVYSREVPA